MTDRGVFIPPTETQNTKGRLGAVISQFALGGPQQIQNAVERAGAIFNNQLKRSLQSTPDTTTIVYDLKGDPSDEKTIVEFIEASRSPRRLF